MSAGRLRTRLAFERESTVPDGGGGRTGGPVPVATLWAQVMPVDAACRIEAGRLDGIVTHRIRIRARGDIGGGLRARTATRRFRILAGHDEDDSRRFRILLAEEEGQ